MNRGLAEFGFHPVLYLLFKKSLIPTYRLFFLEFTRVKKQGMPNYKGTHNAISISFAMCKHTTHSLVKFLRASHVDQFQAKFLLYNDIRRRCLQLADKTFAKTRFSRHVGFISKCLRRGLTPAGFHLNLHASDLRRNGSSSYKRQVSHILNVASRRLMMTTVKTMQLRCQTLSTEINNIRIELKTVCDNDTYRHAYK